MPMEETALEDLKSMLAIARKGPVNYGVCLGKKPENTVMILHRKKAPDFLQRKAKKEGETAKVACGEIEVTGKKASLRCLEDAPPGLQKVLKKFFANTVGLSLKVTLLAADGSVLESDEDEENVAVDVKEEAGPDPRLEALNVTVKELAGQIGSVADPQVQAKLAKALKEIVGFIKQGDADTAEPNLGKLQAIVAKFAGESAPDSKAAQKPDAWTAIAAKIEPQVMAALKVNHPKGDNIKALWKFAQEKVEAGDTASAIKAVKQLAPLLAAPGPEDAKGSVAADDAKNEGQDSGQEDAYTQKLEEVQSVYHLAVKKEKNLKSGWKLAAKLANAGDFDKAIAELDKVKTVAEAKLSGGYQERLSEVDPIYKVVVLLKPKTKELWGKQAKFAADKKYLEAVAVLDKIADVAPGLIKEAVQSWRTAESKAGEQIKFCRDLKATGDGDMAKQGSDLLEKYELAKEAARSQDYPQALRELTDVVAKAKELMKNANQLKESIRDETRMAAKEEQAAYDFVSKMDDKEWGFDTHRDAMGFMLGLSTGEAGESIKSDKLKEMERALTAAIERKNKLVNSGVNPVEAGEIAFRNIPRNFWPPSVVREMAMYERATSQIEAEEQASDLKKEAESGVGESFSGMVKSSTAMAGKVQKATKSGIKALEKTGGMTKDAAEEVTSEVGDFFSGFGTVMKVGSALGSGITAGEKEHERRQVDFNPVREQILEFERNRAIVEMLNNLTDAALDSMDMLMKVMADCKIISGVKDLKAMAIAAAEAGRYFSMLMGTKEIKKGAKADPETMTHLALKQRMKDMKFDFSQKTFTAIEKFVNACAKFTGEAVKYGGGQAAPAGFVIAQAGKVLTFAGKPVFSVWGWSNKRDEKQALKAAAAKPPDYKAIENVFKNSRKYARFALAYAAVEDNDPWARSFIIKRGLTDDMLDHPATSTAIVREYLMVTYEGVSGATQTDTKPKTEGKADKALKALKGVSVKARDKLVGRDTGISYKADWKPNVYSLTLTTWNQTKEEAIAAGWYNDRGSHGKVFALYEKAWNALHENLQYASKGKSITLPENYDRKAVEKFTGEALAASAELRQTLLAIPTLANDGKTKHEGMSFYTGAAYKLLGDREDEVWRVREAAFDQPLGENEEERAQVKQELLDSVLPQIKAVIAKQAQQRDAMVLKAWQAHKCKTPYGSYKLVDFPAAAVKKLKLDDIAKAALIDDVAGLDRACIENIFEAMSGWGDVSAPEASMLKELKGKIPGLSKDPKKAYQKAFDKELGRQLKQMDTSINLALGDFSAVQYKASQGRLGPDAKKSDKTYSHTTRNFDVSGAAWETVKDEFEKDGWKRYSTGIAKAYKAWEKADKEWDALPSDLRYQGTWRATCTTLRNKYEALDHSTDLGFGHPGMQRYRDEMSDRIQQRYDQFKARCNEVGRPDVPAGWQPDHPKTIAFSKRGWKGICDEAKQHDWNGKSPGFGKQFSAFESARSQWNDNYRTDDEKAITKHRTKVHKTLNKLRTGFMDYQPKNKKDRPHAGMLVYKQAMLEKANDYLELIEQENPNCLLPGL